MNNRARATFSITNDKMIERNRARLALLDGVNSVGVNLLSQVLSVEYDPQKITLNRIRKTLNRKT